MNLNDASTVVTGGASGLGFATVHRLIESDAAAVVIADLPTSAGAGDSGQFGRPCALLAVRRPG